MGCAASSVDKEERVQMCKERKRSMKQLIGFRREYVHALSAYLQALRNTGSTLRQFTEIDSLELENMPFSSELPPPRRPLFPLPPSPPPPPPLSPELRKAGECSGSMAAPQEEVIEIHDDENSTPPPPPPLTSSWDQWDILDESMPELERHDSLSDHEDENWAEARSEFEEDDRREDMIANEAAVNSLPSQIKGADMVDEYSIKGADIVDDNSSVVSMQSKDTRDTAMVAFRTKKTLVVIVKELDDYFLKASAGGKEIGVLVDVDKRNSSLHHDYGESKRKGNNSARVFTSLSWTRSSRSFQSSRDRVDSDGKLDPCQTGAHCITLEKLYTEEQRLHKAMREEAVAKMELEKRSLALQKQEADLTDMSKTEKTRAVIENLRCEIANLSETVSTSTSTILGMIEDELHPQLVALLSGLLHLWRTMYECHKAQNHISQQLSHLTNHHTTEPTSAPDHKAVVQLADQVSFWYQSFCMLAKYQREYVKFLDRWIQYTNILETAQGGRSCVSAVCAVCKEWQLALDRLPEKVASEAIKNFLSAIRSIILQLEEEFTLKKKCDKLERRLRREINSLIEMEKKLEASSKLISYGEGHEEEPTLSMSLSPKHPISVKRSKLQALKKRFEGERTKYVHAVEVSHETTLNNIKTALPNVFQALMAYSATSSIAYEAVLGKALQLSDNSEQSYQ